MLQFPNGWLAFELGVLRRLKFTSVALPFTGEPELDRVVPVDVTRRYLNDFARAEHVVLERTGHNGLVTRPDAFAEMLERFVNGVRLSA